MAVARLTRVSNTKHQDATEGDRAHDEIEHLGVRLQGHVLEHLWHPRASRTFKETVVT